MAFCALFMILAIQRRYRHSRRRRLPQRHIALQAIASGLAGRYVFVNEGTNVPNFEFATALRALVSADEWRACSQSGCGGCGAR